MSKDQLPKNEQRALRLASDALACAQAEDWNRAGRVLQRISDECGPTGVGRAILGWSDLLIERIPDFRDVKGMDAVFAPTFVNAETGEMSGPEGVPAKIQWAARILMARAVEDEASWTALMESLPDDPRAQGEHVMALLMVVSMNLNRAEHLQRLHGGIWN